MSKEFLFLATEVVFEYTGLEDIPRDVTIVQFHSSVTEVVDNMFDNCGQLKKVVFNEGLLKIGNYAFFRCRSLKSINLPSTTTEIVGNAFMCCINLEEVALNEGLNKIGTKSFHSCKSLQSITLPSTVTMIGKCAFEVCTKLRNVVFNEGLMTIGYGTFRLCISLESITMPSTLREIGESSFSSCRDLRKVAFNEGLKKIGECAFRNCSMLTKVMLNEGVETIADDAFLDCDVLRKFIFPHISSRLGVIFQSYNNTETETVENKLDEIRGDLIERDGSEVFATGAAMNGGQNWDSIKQGIDKITSWISYYEIKEATTILELALWKWKLNKTMITSHTVERGLHRIDVPGPVKNIILEYLS